MKTRITTLSLPLTVVALLLPAVSQAGEYPFTTENILDSDDALNGAKPQLADLNGDGHEDVLLVGYYYLQWYENGGNFGEPMQERMVDPQIEPDDAAVADVDGDGDLDIVASGDGLRWYENVENAAAFKAHVISDDEGVEGDVDIGDIDGDGDMDVVIADYWADENHWYANPGDPTEDWGNVKVIPSDMYDAIQVLVADFDGDGKDDVLSASEAYFSLLRYQDGPWAEDVLDGRHGDHEPAGGRRRWRRRPRRAARREDCGRVIMRNLGDGLFGEEEIENSGNLVASYQMDMGDVDGDGDDDLIIVMNDYDQAIHYYPNEDGEWGEPQLIRGGALGLHRNGGRRCRLRRGCRRDGPRHAEWCGELGRAVDDQRDPRGGSSVRRRGGRRR